MLCVLIMIRPYRRTLFFTFFVWIVGALWTFDTAGANDFCTCTINIRKSCDCVGNFSTFPPVPLEDFERLHLAHGRLRGINGTSLAHFGRYLTELSIAHMYNFTFIDDHALENLPKLKYIRISYTDLTKIPTLEGLGRIEPMNTISFDNNKIQEVQARGVRTVELLLDCNAIMVIEGWAFNGSEIHKLSLRGNKFLSQLSYHAFNGITKLKELDLSDTLVSSLPPIGLHELEVLKMKNTAALQTMPSILDIKRLQQAWMTYASQCCAFNPTCVDSWKTEEPKFASTVAIIARTRSDTTTARSISLIIDEITRNEKSDGSSSDETSVEVSEFHVHRRGTSYPTVSPMSQRDIQQLCNFFSGRKPVDCSWQQQDALNECDDLIASIWVKGSVWVVLLIALVGNVLVLLIVTLSHSEKTVARFLTCNLAFADLCMAVYLFLLATMDAISSKMYHNYAYLWQQGVGCKIAGFLTIFSCQLSFFTLSLLTMERWFSIKRALYSNLLDTRMTTMIMTCGWFYSLMMATLPLFGISSYSSASICLPMDIHDYPSLVYILVLIGTGGIAFLLMCFCYCQIYLSLRQETRHPKGGRSVARKIFILVATNFFCWSPIAFFALAAVTGHPLISTTKSKLLLLFIYPINSCANPYLYVIMTKQFKKDLIMLLARYGFCTQVAEQYRMNYSRPMSHDTYQTTVNSTKSFVV